MIKFFRWCGAIFMVLVWLLGKMLISEMERLGKFADFGELLIVFIYITWIALCVILFLWIKPASKKKEKEKPKLTTSIRQRERRRAGERRAIIKRMPGTEKEKRN